MYRYDELAIVRGPETKQSVAACVTRFFVTCHAIPRELGWLQSRDVYLYSDGLWRESAPDERGISGYFDTIDHANSELERSKRIMTLDALVIPANIDAQATIARMRKSEFLT